MITTHPSGRSPLAVRVGCVSGASHRPEHSAVELLRGHRRGFSSRAAPWDLVLGQAARKANPDPGKVINDVAITRETKGGAS